ncbi:MAG: thiolase family protein [Nevskia sp.]|nr:thiolase family protein [Nevskia sp.]
MSAPRKAAIVGYGFSDVFRGPGLDVEALTAQSCLAAIADAGVRAADIDGIFEYQIGAESPKCLYVQRLLGTGDLASYTDIMGSGASGFAGVVAALSAVESGACEVALVFRSMQQQAGNTGSASGDPVAQAGYSPLHDEIVAPYGMFGIIPATALRMCRRQVEYGTRPQDYGYVAINARRWAALNERAVQRNALTMEGYLSAKLLCDPLRLLDCDYPVSGSCALIITTQQRARDLRHKPVMVAAHAQATGSGDWLHGADFLHGGTIRCAERLWRRSGLEPNDIDFAQVYDGFTYSVLTWIEALGFCGLGEAGDWIEQGRRIGPGGSLPLNTNGGQLAEGRLHGLAAVAESVMQLRGDGGSRQVRDAETAVVTVSWGPQCAGMVLICP